MRATTIGNMLRILSVRTILIYNALLFWWNRPAGGREVWTIAWPLVISSLSWTVMTFVDRVFLAWVSGDAMAAAFSASMVWFTILCLPLGICTYANTFVSQYHGDKQPEQIGPAVWQAIWMALAFTPIILAFIPLAPMIFSWAGHSPEIQRLEVEYFQILLLGGSGMLVAQAASAFYSGRGHTQCPMWVDGFYALLNLVLDYLWIFGYAGFPAMGIAGAGYATSLALWLKAATYVALMLQPKYRTEYQTASGIRLDRKIWQRLAYYGGPSGMQMLLDVLGFTLFVMLVGRLGSLEAEATSMAFSISTLAFMPIWGFGLAAGILVGQHLGENRPDLAESATWTTLWIALTYMAIISLCYLVIPDLFLGSFFAHNKETSLGQSQLRELAKQLLRFVAAYNLLDATLTVFVNAIKGAGDTQFVLKVSCCMGIVLAGFSYLAVEVWQLGVYGCWVIITAWVWGLGLMFLGRFRQGAWRNMRVIEMHGSAPPSSITIETSN
jgi:multidrug resistance protein, MATE family